MEFDLKKILNEIAGALHKVIQNSYEPIFNAVQNTLYHQATYTIILLVVIFWLLKLLKTGYPTRDDLFEAGKWTGLVLCIYAIFYSYNGYTEFIKLLNLPANWLRNATGQLIEIKDGNVIDIITQTFAKLKLLQEKLWATLLKHNADDYNALIEFMAYFETAFDMLPYYLFYISFLFLTIGVILVVQVSGYIALIVLTIAPAMIPLLFNKNLRQYFFSWLKLYISYSLYAPLALVILSIALGTIQRGLDLPTEVQEIATGFWSIFVHFAPAIILSLLCIYLLLQIPNWVSQVMGIQGLSSGGVGTGVGLMAGTAIGVATGGLGAVAGGMLAKAQGGSVLAGAAKGGLGAIAKKIPGAETITATFEKRSAKTKDATASVQ